MTTDDEHDDRYRRRRKRLRVVLVCMALPMVASVV